MVQNASSVIKKQWELVALELVALELVALEMQYTVLGPKWLRILDTSMHSPDGQIGGLRTDFAKK